MWSHSLLETLPVCGWQKYIVLLVLWHWVHTGNLVRDEKVNYSTIKKTSKQAVCLERLAVKASSLKKWQHSLGAKLYQSEPQNIWNNVLWTDKTNV